MNTRDGGDEGQSSDKKQEEDGDGENDHGKQRSQQTRSSSTSLATRYSTFFFNLFDASQATSPCFSARSWMRASQEGILPNGGTRVFTTSKAEPR